MYFFLLFVERKNGCAATQACRNRDQLKSDAPKMSVFEPYSRGVMMIIAESLFPVIGSLVELIKDPLSRQHYRALFGWSIDTLPPPGKWKVMDSSNNSSQEHSIGRSFEWLQWKDGPQNWKCYLLNLLFC